MSRGDTTDARIRGLRWWPDRVFLAIVVLATAGWYTAVELRHTFPGFPLDDTWIHLQFARNLGTGHGLSYNPGIPVAGSTAPLWTLVLAGPAALRLDPIWSTKVLGIVLTILTVFVAASLGERLSGSRAAGLAAGASVALAPLMAWGALSGMEVPLYALLASAALLTYLNAVAGSGFSGWWGLLIGLAGAARPEAFVLFPLMALDWVFRWRGAGAGVVRGRARWWPLLLFAAVLAVFVGVNLAVSGRPLPVTFYAKTYGMGAMLSLSEGRGKDALWAAAHYPRLFVEQYFRWASSHLLLLVFGLPVGLLALTGVMAHQPAVPGRWLVALVPITAAFLKGLLAPEPPLLVHDGRYVAHLLVATAVTSVVGFSAMVRLSRVRWAVVVLLATALVRLAAANASGAERYAGMVKNINDLQRATARWLTQQTLPGARIATNDIGAIAYFSGRFIIDTEGLVTPEAIWPKRMRRFVPFLSEVKPDLLIIFPSWYPEIVSRTDLFQEIYRIEAEQVAAGGPALVFYRTPWTRAEVLRPPFGNAAPSAIELGAPAGSARHSDSSPRP